MLEDKPIRKLYYTEQVGPEKTLFVLWRGGEFVGCVTSRAEADYICRNNQEFRRLASDRTNDLRRHSIEQQRLKHEIEILVGALRKVTAVLRKGKEKEMLAAREAAGTILRKFNAVHGEIMQKTAGFSIAEALVVLVLSFFLLTFATTVISQGVRASRIKAASHQFTMDLRLARLTAVSKRTVVDLVVSGDPVNEYQYTDSWGRIRRGVMPPGVRITTSTTPIRFLPNGSVQGGATTVLEAPLTNSILERRTIATSVLGISTLTVNRTES